MAYRILTIIFCVIPWILAISILIWFIQVRYPAATFVTDAYFDGTSAWVQTILPGNRATKAGLQQDGWTGQSVTGDPVYFTAHVPGLFERVRVALEFRPVHQPLIEFGLVHSEDGSDIELHPLFASELQSPMWKPVTDGYVHSSGTTEAVWYASSTYPALSDISAVTSTTSTMYNISLRGSHDFYAVPVNGQLHFRFSLQDVNRATGTNIIVFRILKGDEEIRTDSFVNDGGKTMRMDKVFEHAIDVSDAGPGVYHISFIAKDDVFIRRIETNAIHMVIGPRFVLADTSGYVASSTPVIAYTNSHHVVVETFHPSALQRIRFGITNLDIRDVHVRYKMKRVDTSPTVQLFVPKGDTRFIGDGFFSFQQDAFFEPRPRRFNDETQLEEENIHFIRTPYIRPMSMDGGWFRSEQTYTISPNASVIRFILSAPGIVSRAAGIDIRAIHLSYERTPAHGIDWLRLVMREIIHALRRL